MNPAESAPTQPDMFLVMMLSGSLIQTALGFQGKTISSSGEVEYQDIKNVMAKADQALQELGPQSEGVNRLFFALEPSWTNSQGEVLPERKPLLKKITDDLGLEPAGFVITPEAVLAQYLVKDPLLSCIWIYLEPTALVVSVISQGKTTQTVTVGRSDDVVADTTEALARVVKALGSEGYLPARILVLGLAETEESRKRVINALTDQDWEASFSFLQKPVVEWISHSLMIEAITAQTGVAKTPILDATPLLSHSPTLPPEKSEEELAPDPEESDLPNDRFTPPEEKLEDESESFGFVEQSPFRAEPAEAGTEAESEPILEDESANALPVAAVPSPLPPTSPPRASIATSFGVPFSLDNAESSYEHPQPKLTPAFSAQRGDTPVSGFKANFSPVKAKNSILSQLFLHDSGQPHVKRQVVAGLVAGLIAVVLFFITWLKTSASVLIVVLPASVPVTQEIQLTIDPTATNSDPAARVLKGSTVSKEVLGEDFIQTTGVKLIGEKAVGKITIQNKTSEQKTFAAGTKFSTSELSFTLDQETTVPAATTEETDDSATTVFGKISATVTAVEVGADSNIAKDLDFTVESFASTSFSAVSEVAFTGGASREVKVVSQKDRQTLLDNLTTTLVAQAADQFNADNSAGDFITPSGNQKQITAEFDAKVDEEADILNLKLTLEVEGVKYSLSELQPLAKEVLAQDLPAGYVLSSKDPEILSAPAKKTASGTKASSLLTLDVSLRTTAVAEITTENLKPEVANKPLAEVEAYLTDKENIAGAKVTTKPTLASLLLKQVPKNLARIEIKVQE